MRLKILIGVLLFLIVVNIATIGSYIYFRVQDNGDRRNDRFDLPGDFPRRFSRPPHLDLTPEQMQQLLELRMSFAEATKGLSLEIAKSRGEIYELLKRDSVSWTSIEEKLQQIANLRIQIEKVAIKKLIEAQDYLSSEQREHLFRFLLMEPSPMKGAPSFRRDPGFRDRDQIKRHNNKNKE